jgi:hypothetical protein
MDNAEAIELAGGYTLELYVEEGQTNFYVLRPNGSKVHTVYVRLPLPPRQSWRRAWDPELDYPEYGNIQSETLGGYRRHGASPADALAVSEALALAASYCVACNEARIEELAWQEYARRDAREREAREEANRDRARQEIKEAIQWYIGNKFKLRRAGYKATVFGTIDRVTDTIIYTASERNVRMQTLLSDLEQMWVMYDGEKRYTKVFDRAQIKIS